MTVVRAYVSVTDLTWYRFLAARPQVTEVKFLQPSGGREFRVLAPGEPFFFKTHYAPQHGGRRRVFLDWFIWLAPTLAQDVPPTWGGSGHVAAQESAAG